MAVTAIADVAVIGRGMIGSAAARHLAEAGQSVVLIGSSEPPNYSTTDLPFASHYDEYRITRISAADPVWADLAVRSIERYRDIAARSGVNFYQPTGLVTAAQDAERTVQIAVERGSDARLVEADQVRATTGINLPDSTGMTFLYEDTPAGVISPRRLVTAQVQLAADAGATLVEHPATTVRRRSQGFEIDAGGESTRAHRIVLATGAYGAELVDMSLEIERPLRTVLHVELDPADSVPCLIVERPDHDELDRLYWTAPKPYVDGKVRLKVGASVIPMRSAAGPADIAAWFAAGGSATEADSLLQAVRSLLPAAKVLDHHHTPCVMTTTTTEYPYVGKIDEGVVVALGGNGSSAKSSDEIGRLASVASCGGSDDLLEHLAPRLAG